jgi:hypothetical protein
LSKFAALIVALLSLSISSCIAGTITGKVLPLGIHAQVTATSDDSSGQEYKANVRSDGRFGIVHLPPGRYTVEPQALGYIQVPHPVAWEYENLDISKNGTVDVPQINMRPVGTLELRISPEDADARLSIDGIDNKFFHDDVAQNEFSLDCLPQGKFKLRLSARGYADGDYDFTIQAHKTTHMAVTLGKSGSISGTIVPCPSNGEVYLRKTGERYILPYHSTIDSKGHYKISGMPAGKYDLVVLVTGCEVVIGYGNLPAGTDTLTSQDRKQIGDLFDSYHSAISKRDLAKAMSLFSKDYMDENNTDYNGTKKELADLFAGGSFSPATRKNFIMKGKTGERAWVVYFHGYKEQSAFGEEVDNGDDIQDEMVYENRAWHFHHRTRVSAMAFFKGDEAVAAVAATQGPFPAKWTWRYSDDPSISAIQVTNGIDSTGHDVTLTPIN